MRIVFLVFALAAPLVGCSQQGRKAMDARQALVGSSKEQILACMGSPSASRTEGGTEVWTYQAAGDSAGMIIGGNMAVVNYSCTANVVMANGVVSRVNYSGRTGGGLSEGKACYPLIENCIQ